ncbi:unnamed protein product [Bemisia tabaci]|uniref:LITAF domain-containing protein n=1 Tax=Bemisia tabaci TaxID=7038 RepID=A0A9P0EVL7_BEMTA|nr:unnamed protein product [Bemisia tabaci]
MQEFNKPTALYPAVNEVVTTPPASAPPAYNQVIGQHVSGVGRAEVHEMASPGYNQITVEVFPTLGADPAYIRCPHCREEVITKTNTSSRCCAHVCCCTMLITGICIPFCWVPYCMKSCERTTHRCPKCKKMLGTHRG